MRIVIRDGVPWKEMQRSDGTVYYETTTPGEDAVEIERLRGEMARLRRDLTLALNMVMQLIDLHV